MIRIEGLRHGYGARTVLDIRRWGVAAGEVSLIIGPSGSGKTTLLHLVGGLLQPDEGRIAIDGTDITHLGAAALDRLRGGVIAMVSEDLRLAPTLSVRGNLWLAARLAGRAAHALEIGETLERLDVAHCAHQRPGALSHGEVQRAALARALIARPRVLLADEPTSALDDDNAVKVVDVLRQHARELGSAVVIATHDYRVKGAGDRALTLRMGEAS